MLEPLPDARPRRSSLTLLWALVLIATTAAALSVAFYFAVSLPTYNRDRLTRERQKYADEQGQRKASATAAAAQETERQLLLQTCLADAETHRLEYLKLNGTVTTKGTISTKEVVVRTADDRKKADTDACFQQFRR
jgi:hypothetical protein